MGVMFADGIAATTYDRYVKGQITDQNAAKLDTFVAMQNLGMGKFVVRKAGKKQAELPKEASVAKDFVGLVVMKNNLWQDHIPTGQGAPIGKIGRFAVVAHGGCNAGDTVHVIKKDDDAAMLGEVKGAADSANTVELNGVKFATDAADGELVEIVIDGNLTIGA